MTRLRSLRWRLGLLYALVAAVMLAVVLLAVGAVVEAALVKSAAERLEIEAGLVVADAGGGPKGPRATDLAAGDLATILGGQGTAVVILDGTGSTTAAQPNGAPATVFDARLDPADYAAVVAEARTIQRIRPAADGSRVLVVAAPVELRTTGAGNASGTGSGNGNGNGRGLGNQKPGKGDVSVAPGVSANAVAQLAISLGPIDATLAELRVRIAIVGLAVLAGAIALAWLVTGLGLRPLARVAAAADRIAAGDLAARTGLPGGGDEVGRLGRAFDGMADRVDATLGAQRQFAADASHELRSPLTVLGGYVDVLARGEIEPGTKDRTLGAMRREIDRLSRLSADLLLLTQLEAGGSRLVPRPLDLSVLIEDIGTAATVIGPDRRVEIVRDGPLPIVADPDRLTQALMNLVDNAIRHAPVGGLVRLTSSRDRGEAVAEVSNEGDPLAATDVDRVFDRFYRADTATTPTDGPHAGLGLAIVKAIVEASGGTVSAASDLTGTRFSIRLPITAGSAGG
ncbi:MAG TPA: HAMP domain-containing sensor histidine kinase, partial [Candidatus Limnocylindrales bacterium]|nr:HAMP domain-containing sensor histidine kinase [Candidatus Limnocylindrales bacterium]